MSVFKKQRKWIYIAFVIITVIIIAIIIIPKLTGNLLTGSWETSDGLRKYTFDENTLTVSSKINSYSKLYGYSYKNNTLALQDSGNTKYYTVTIKGSEIVISSADSDSPEILHRVE